MKRMRNYRAVLFDMDGTLIDSFDGIVELFLESLSALGVTSATEQSVREVIGFPLADCFARFVAAEHVDRAVAYYRARYEVRMHDISPPFPGAVELLDALRAAGIGTGIVSNKRAAAVRAIIGGKGWPLSIIVAEGDGFASKPAPDMLHHACDRLSLSREHVLYVGDSHLDAEAARAAGIDFAGVLTGELKSFHQFPHVGAFESLTHLHHALLGPQTA